MLLYLYSTLHGCIPLRFFIYEIYHHVLKLKYTRIFGQTIYCRVWIAKMLVPSFFIKFGKILAMTVHRKFLRYMMLATIYQKMLYVFHPFFRFLTWRLPLNVNFEKNFMYDFSRLINSLIEIENNPLASFLLSVRKDSDQSNHTNVNLF